MRHHELNNNEMDHCGEPAISRHSYTVPQVQWSTRLLPVMRDPGSIPRETGILSSCYIVLLHWWPRRDWSLWPWLRRASFQTITRLPCRQCDNPTWSRTALLSQVHACCRSSFWLHNYIVGCWGELCGEPAISLLSYTVLLVQWSTCLLPVMRDPSSIPRGLLMWNHVIFY